MSAQPNGSNLVARAGKHRAPFVWEEMTRNCHVGSLGGVAVVTVERPQKNRPDGTRPGWSIVVLGDRYTWNDTFCHYDARDLVSTKSGAEARTRWAIECLYKSMRGIK